MALYQKVDDVWVLASKPYGKKNGVWATAEEAWVKRSGAWVRAYDADVTPPDPPELTLQIIEDRDSNNKLLTRYIKVGARLPGVQNDPDAQLIRVLSTFNGKAPTTQFGATYTAGSDSTFPNEPWSEWRYNSYGAHNDTSVVNYKQWPRNVTTGVQVDGDTDYFFTGWSLDNSGNWSTATPVKIHVPKASIEIPNVIVKEATFQANSSGSWRTVGFQHGDVIQQKSPRSQGLWFYGNQFHDSIGKQGPASIRNAQIFIRRRNDTGNASANIYLFWTAYGSQSALPAPGAPGGIARNEVTKLGQLAKGESQWFALPTTFNNDLRAGNIKGMGLDWKDPIKADAFPADYSVVVGVADNPRVGELHVVWEETL